jgi:Prophage CP4-57 regulatory protein (AlpA)
MSLDPTAAAPRAASRDSVSISRWVNEPLPPWHEILTARDVARLARRPPWLLSGMALLGRFPRQRRFRGRAIGWLRSDVLDWIASDLDTPAVARRRDVIPRRSTTNKSKEQCLPLECTFVCLPQRRYLLQDPRMAVHPKGVKP